MNPMIRRSGLDLRVLRIKADVKVLELAAAMGTQASAVSRIESSRNVTPKAEARYLDALATLITATKPQEAA